VQADVPGAAGERVRRQIADAMGRTPRELHEARRRLGKLERVVRRPEKAQLLRRLAVDEQVAGVNTCHFLAEENFNSVKRAISRTGGGQELIDDRRNK